MKSGAKLASWALIGLMGLNIAATAWYVVLHAQTRQVRPKPALSEGSHFPMLSGVDVLGKPWIPNNARCRVLRVSDDSCSFCLKDQDSYEQLLKAARSASCEIVEFAPKAGGLSHNPRPGVVQLKFIEQDVGGALYPFMTPQTVILDHQWSVMLTQRGIFTKDSLKFSIDLLRSMDNTRASNGGEAKVTESLAATR